MPYFCPEKQTVIMATTYLWQQKDWPHFQWEDSSLSPLLAEVNMLRGQLMGRLHMVGLGIQESALIETLTQEIVHSSAIEGEQLNRDSVRSSIARQLGLERDGLPAENHYIEGVVQVMLNATQNYDTPLTPEQLFGWHAALFPTGYSGSYRIDVAKWREGDTPMQVVSGALGHQKVHYEAPPSHKVPEMMEAFFSWANQPNESMDPLVKAAVAHLWFITIHPFDDGNGRIARTLTELFLSRADNTCQRYYSLSSVVALHRRAYYQILELTQKGGMDITPWIEWFLCSLREAISQSLLQTERVVQKTAFWDRHRATSFNERQRKVLNRMLDGFEGKLTTSKWYKIAHCSQDTALRDIQDLIQKGILRSTSKSGRSTSYVLCD